MANTIRWEYFTKRMFRDPYPRDLGLWDSERLEVVPTDRLVELLLLIHPTDVGVKVFRSDILRELENRGEAPLADYGFYECPRVNRYVPDDLLEPGSFTVAWRNNPKDVSHRWSTLEHCALIDNVPEWVAYLEEVLEIHKTNYSKLSKAESKYHSIVWKIRHLTTVIPEIKSGPYGNYRNDRAKDLYGGFVWSRKKHPLETYKKEGDKIISVYVP
jgi:hypothetical protein